MAQDDSVPPRQLEGGIAVLALGALSSGRGGSSSGGGLLLGVSAQVSCECTDCPVSPSCPNSCNADQCTTYFPSCNCTQTCSTVGCGSGYEEFSALPVCGEGDERERVCKRPCGPIGTLDCSGGCKAGRWGTPSCDQVCPGGVVGSTGEASGYCSGVGTCNSVGQCKCNSGYAGLACQYSDAVTCNGHGTVNALGGCSCNTGWTGARCASCATNYYGTGSSCTYCLASTTCSGNGTCNTATGACQCLNQFFTLPNCATCTVDAYGRSCKYCTAASTCSGHGTCSTIDGSCICTGNFTGLDCSSCLAGFKSVSVSGVNTCQPCPGELSNPCSGSGTCQSGTPPTCGCNANYAGSFCQYSRAVTCSNHGTPTALGTCDCDSGYNGTACASCAPDYYNYPMCT